MLAKKLLGIAMLGIFTFICILPVNLACADSGKPYLGTWLDNSDNQVHKYIFSEDKVDYQIGGKSEAMFPEAASYTPQGKGYNVNLQGMKFFYLEIKSSDTMNVCDAWNPGNCVLVTREK